MNYYAFHIGDYASATAHLTSLEDIAYRRLLDRYYMGERPLTSNLDDLCRLTRMRTECERNAVAVVVAEFFICDGEKLISSRAEKELQEYAQKSSKAKASAKVRWDKEKTDANALRTQSECNAPNTITNTNNQKKESAQKRAHQMPTDFVPNANNKNVSVEVGANLESEIIKFADFHKSKGSTFKDWNLALNTWLRNTTRFGSKPSKPDFMATPGINDTYGEI